MTELVPESRESTFSTLVYKVLSISEFSSESGIQEFLYKYFESDFQLISFYGEYDPCLMALSNFFQDCLPEIPKMVSLGLLVSPLKGLAALFYIAVPEKSLDKKPLHLLNPICYYMPLLLEASSTLIACFSQNNVESWYFSNDFSIKNQFFLKLKHICQEGKLRKKYSYSKTYEMNSDFLSYKNSAFSTSSAYYYTFPEININSKAEVQKANSELILALFDKKFSIDNYQSLCINHISKIEEFISCPAEIANRIFEVINDALLKQRTEISEVYSGMCDKIINGVLLTELKIDQNEKGLLTKSSFSFGIEKFRKKVMEKMSDLNLERIFDVFRKEIYKFIEETEARRKLISKIIRDAWEEANVQNEKFTISCRDTVYKTLLQLENYLIQKKVKIIKMIPEINSQGNLVFVDSENPYLISFHVSVSTVKQVIEVEINNMLLVVEDKVKGSTDIYMINRNKQKKVLTLQYINVEIAKGSTLEKVIVIINSRKMFFVYALKKDMLDKVKKFDTIDHSMNFPHFIENSNKILFINQENVLMNYVIQGDLVTAEIFDWNDFSHTTNLMTLEYLNFSASENGEAIALLAHDLIIFVEFSTKSYCEFNWNSKDIEKVQIIKILSDYKLLILGTHQIKVLKLRFTDLDSENEENSEIGNPIFDVINISLINSCQNHLIKCKNLYCYKDSNLSDNLIYKYYQELLPSSSQIELKSIINSFEYDFELSPYSNSNFLSLLSRHLKVKIAKINPFWPLTNCKDKIDEISKLSPNPSVVEYYSYFFSFGIIEEALNNIEDIKVVGLIGLDFSELSRLGKNLFNIDFSFGDLSYLSIGISEINSQKILVILMQIGPDKLTDGEMKSIEFINSISDAVIFNLDYNYMKKLRAYLSKIFFCNNRINDEKLYQYKFFISLISVGNDLTDLYSVLEIIPFSLKFTLLQFSKFDSEMFDKEIILAKETLNEIPQKWQGKRLAFAIRTVMAQLFVEDNHSLGYWENKKFFIINSVCLGEECEHEGICDREIEKINKYNEELNRKVFIFNEKCIRLKTSHEKIENVHYCDQRCEFCNGFCELEFGHFGLHSLKMHRRPAQCSIKFFNTNIFGYLSNIKKIEKFEFLSKKNWETPWESIMGDNDFCFQLEKNSENSIEKQFSLDKDRSMNCKIF